jgi:hypothetical protein
MITHYRLCCEVFIQLFLKLVRLMMVSGICRNWHPHYTVQLDV